MRHYNARWYDPTLGRFVQADTVVPGEEPLRLMSQGLAVPAGSGPAAQGYDRYAYVLNDPVALIDPGGHVGCLGSNWDDGPQCKEKAENKELYDKNIHEENFLQGHMFVSCGSEQGGDKGVCNNGKSLNHWLAWARANGYGFSIYDFDICGSKAACAELEFEQMQDLLAGRPDLKFVLVGHSAGADSVILVANRAMGTAIQSQISHIVLLGPSGDYTNLQTNQVESTITMANVVVDAYGNLVFVGDIHRNGIITSPADHYKTYSSPVDHMGLATDLTVFKDAMGILGLVCNIDACR